MVRLSTINDIDSINKFVDDFSDENLFGYGVFDKDKTKANIVKFVDNSTAFMFEIEDKIVGGITGVITKCLFTQDILFSSMFFYIDNPYRIHAKKFIDELALLIKAHGVTKLIIGNPAFNNFERLDKFYRLIGFQHLETHYFKAV